MVLIPPGSTVRLVRPAFLLFALGVLFLGGCATTGSHVPGSASYAPSVRNDNIPAIRYVFVIDADCRLESFAGKSVGEVLVYTHDNLIFVNRSGRQVTVEFVTPQTLDAGSKLVLEPDARQRVVVPKRKKDFFSTDITVSCAGGGAGSGPSIKVGDGP
jgi:hypothetical protein